MGAFPHRPPLQDPWPRPSKLHKRGPAPQSHAAKNQTVRTCCTDARRNSDGTTKEILFVLPGPTRPDPSPIMRRRESDQHTQMDRRTPERNNHNGDSLFITTYLYTRTDRSCVYTNKVIYRITTLGHVAIYILTALYEKLRSHLVRASSRFNNT